MDQEAQLRTLYDAFNARDIDTALAGMAEDVDWPNGWEGGREHGRAAVREYWTRQWAAIDSRAVPVAVETRPEGRVVVEVDQAAYTPEGEPLGEERVLHVYEFRDGLVTRMDIEDAG